MILYHGSFEMVEEPRLGYGKLNNDYGQGFYCTEDIELAREWACRDINGGLVNKYELDVNGLRVLDLRDIGILPWIAILMANRIVRYSSPVEKRAAEYLISNYLPETDGYDVIIGYRADDSYFSYTRAFLSNTITVEQLEMAVQLGNLGTQICIKSQKGFENISFIEANTVSGEVYYPRRIQRDNKAKDDYYRLLEESAYDGTYVRDIIERGKKS